MKKRHPPKLSILQKRLCDIYHSMRHPNQEKAYTLAGGKCRGKAAAVTACKMLKKAKCREYLKKLGDRAMERAEKTADDVIRELEKLGFSNIKHYLSFNEGGVKLKDSGELSDEQLACISEVSEAISVKGNKYLRFKLYDKKSALELLARKFQLLTDQADQEKELHVHIHSH